MNLMTKTAVLVGLASLLALLLAGWLTHWFLAKTFDDEATGQLRHEQRNLQAYAAYTGTLPGRFFSLTDSVLVIPVTRPTGETLSDTVFFNAVENEPLRYRRLSFDVKTGNALARVTIQKALYEMEDLAEALLVGALALFVLLVGVLALVNYGLARRLWRPFYQTLDVLRPFRLSQSEPLRFAPSNTREFQLLQTRLADLTEQGRREYQSLKAFTENAAHELQTPLAVLRSKLEVLLQIEHLGEDPTRRVAELLDAVRRLTKLNQSLLLLTKIENRQFDERQEIAFTPLIESKLHFFADWLGHKHLRVDTDLDAAVQVPMHPHLADVLLNNLLTNAIRHNSDGGGVRIVLTTSGLQLSNTGPAPTTPTETLWERFRKARPDSDSPGLGLALVREIAQAHGFTTRYDYADGWHTVNIGF